MRQPTPEHALLCRMVMRCRAIASDYDGTLAENGRVRDDVLDALRRFKESGRSVILVTGRVLPELREVCPELDVFDAIVAENGAVLYVPGEDEAECPLCDAPPAELERMLAMRGVSRVVRGRVIVATWKPYDETVVEIIREHALALEVIFNKGAVMILPAGVTKATGLARALERLGLDAGSVVGVGDAENDHVLLEACGVGAAVANATPDLKASADLVLGRERGEGVRELVERILATDLVDLLPVRGELTKAS